MRYHLVCHEGKGLTGEYGYSSPEAANSARSRMLEWQRDINRRLLEDHTERLRTAVLDLDCDDSTPDLYGPRLERETYSVVECHDRECVPCLEAGLVEPWLDLVW
jgi:hypothetical protein